MMGTFRRMRLATFNILQRSVDRRTAPFGLDRLADAVRTLDADVLALQEVDRLQQRSHLADLTAVAADAMGAAVPPVRGGAVRDAGSDLDRRDRSGIAGQRRRTGSPCCPATPRRSWQVLRLPRIPIEVPDVADPDRAR